MRSRKIHLPNPAYIAAFVIGVILFGSIWKMLFGTASSIVIVAGVVGVVVAVIMFWFWNESGKQDHNDE